MKIPSFDAVQRFLKNSPRLILLILVAAIVILQIISAVFMIRMSRTYQAVVLDHIRIDQDRQHWNTLHQELPALVNRHQELTAAIADQESRLQSMAEKREKWLAEEAAAKEIIVRSQEAAQIRGALKQAVEKLQQEIQARTTEVSQLIGPTAVLNQSAKTLDEIIADQKQAASQMRTEIKKTLDELQAASVSIGKEAIHIRSQALTFAQSVQSSTATVETAGRTSQTAAQTLTASGTALAKQAEALAARIDGFDARLKAVIDALQAKP